MVYVCMYVCTCRRYCTGCGCVELRHAGRGVSPLTNDRISGPEVVSVGLCECVCALMSVKPPIRNPIPFLSHHHHHSPIVSKQVSGGCSIDRDSESESKSASESAHSLTSLLTSSIPSLFSLLAQSIVINCHPLPFSPHMHVLYEECAVVDLLTEARS